MTKSKGTALDAIILPTSHFSCPLLRGVNRAGLKSQAFFKVLPKKKKKKVKPIMLSTAKINEKSVKYPVHS